MPLSFSIPVLFVVIKIAELNIKKKAYNPLILE